MWVPDEWQPLPSMEWLLTLADHAKNKMKNRDYGTFAVGAVGTSPLKTKLVIGVNSKDVNSGERNIRRADSTKPKLIELVFGSLIPPGVRNATELFNVAMAQEPYHAEVSCLLWAKQNSMELFAVASSRDICPICHNLLRSHAPDAEMADTWIRGNGSRLTQNDRQRVSLDPEWTSEMKDLKATCSRQ